MKKIKNFLKAFLYKEYILSIKYGKEFKDFTANSRKDLQLIIVLHELDYRTHKWILYKKGRFFLPKRIIDFNA